MVYIDNYNAPYGRMLMCHMIADSTDELLQMVDKIGVKRKWLQHQGTPYEHFDICRSKKELAILNGAKEISVRELAFKCYERRKKSVTRRRLLAEEKHEHE